MKKAQTAQRTAALDVFLDRAVSDGERSETIRELEQISKNEKSPDRAADCSFGCVFFELLIEATHPRSALPRHDN